MTTNKAKNTKQKATKMSNTDPQKKTGMNEYKLVRIVIYFILNIYTYTIRVIFLDPLFIGFSIVITEMRPCAS
jgi:hypothetical protein